jgi:hypothetical protein
MEGTEHWGNSFTRASEGCWRGVAEGSRLTRRLSVGTNAIQYWSFPAFWLQQGSRVGGGQRVFGSGFPQ